MNWIDPAGYMVAHSDIPPEGGITVTRGPVPRVSNYDVGQLSAKFSKVPRI